MSRPYRRGRAKPKGRRRQPKLLTGSGRRHIHRLTRTEFAMRFRAPLLVGGSLLCGAGSGGAVLIAGDSIGLALLAAGITAAMVITFFLVAAKVLGRPVLPLIGSLPEDTDDSEPPHRAFMDEEAAGAEARRLNLSLEPTDPYYWIQVERSPGIWILERRPLRRMSAVPPDLGGP